MQVLSWWFWRERDGGAGAGAIVRVSRGGRHRVWQLTREDVEVLARVLLEMLDGSGKLEWCDNEGSGCRTRGEDEDVADHRCNNSDRVSDEGATGGGFPACAAVAGRGHGDYGV
ncbi:hypothetical protein DEO72_LG10g1812 [Vigna unguiculata]|uniref:Uncharacterized protein n=1 Tax=Vigna unguiculata TaxID=3917 RepID=A0A4D6NCE6_VIGUN|nr:hypothetical protein DEO72_LG10g1812 [Vigna unguiculata]